MITLKEFGSFYLPGRKIITPENYSITYDIVKDYTPDFLKPEKPKAFEYIIEQAYVQYFIPERNPAKPPIILIHGGGQTGSVWENTPDGRKGWLHYLLELGYPCYILDNVERGRSGWCSIPNVWQGTPELRPSQESWDLFRMGQSENFSSRVGFENQKFPVAHFDSLLDYTVPRWRYNSESSIGAITTLLSKIGKSIIIAHCQSGIFALESLMRLPDLVDSLIVIEPPVLPAHEHINDVAINNKNILFVYGDFIMEHPFWKENFSLAKDLATYLKNHGANAKLLHLPETGLKGNSHMMQMDINNQEVLNTILRFL